MFIILGIGNVNIEVLKTIVLIYKKLDRIK